MRVQRIAPALGIAPDSGIALGPETARAAGIAPVAGTAQVPETELGPGTELVPGIAQGPGTERCRGMRPVPVQETDRETRPAERRGNRRRPAAAPAQAPGALGTSRTARAAAPVRRPTGVPPLAAARIRWAFRSRWAARTRRCRRSRLPGRSRPDPGSRSAAGSRRQARSRVRPALAAGPATGAAGPATQAAGPAPRAAGGPSARTRSPPTDLTWRREPGSRCPVRPRPRCRRRATSRTHPPAARACDGWASRRDRSARPDQWGTGAYLTQTTWLADPFLATRRAVVYYKGQVCQTKPLRLRLAGSGSPLGRDTSPVTSAASRIWSPSTRRTSV